MEMFLTSLGLHYFLESLEMIQLSQVSQEKVFWQPNLIFLEDGYLLQILYITESHLSFQNLAIYLHLHIQLIKIGLLYIETQDFSSDLYKDQIFRTGAAYLFNDDLQFEATLGSNTKNSPSIFFLTLVLLIDWIFIKMKIQK